MPKTLVPLHELAHARAGDKGNRLNISLIAYGPDIWPTLVEQVTETCVADLFSLRGVTGVHRYLLPNLQAMNFVLDNVLEGGVNASLNLDTHGKTLSFLLLGHKILVSESLI